MCESCMIHWWSIPRHVTQKLDLVIWWKLLQATCNHLCVRATMGYYGLLWATMGYYGLLWATMGYYGLLWATMGYYGLLHVGKPPYAIDALWAPGSQHHNFQLSNGPWTQMPFLQPDSPSKDVWKSGNTRAGCEYPVSQDTSWIIFSRFFQIAHRSWMIMVDLSKWGKNAKNWSRVVSGEFPNLVAVSDALSAIPQPIPVRDLL